MIQKHYLNILASSKQNDYSWTDLISLTNYRIDISCSLFDHAHQHLINENDIIWRLIKIIFYGESTNATTHTFTGQRNNNRKQKNTLNMNDIDLLYKTLFDKATMIQTSMLLNIPYIKSVLFNTFIHFLEDIANKKILPRDSKTLSLLTSILQISSQPFLWYRSGKKTNNKHNGMMVSLQQKQNAMELKIPKPDHKVLFEFTPLLTSCIYIDSLGIDLNDLDEEDQGIGRLNNDMIKWCKDNVMCLYILLYYLLFLINKKKISRIMEIIHLCNKNQLDTADYLALNGLTEINLICKAVLKLNDEALNSEVLIKLTIKQKCKIVEFLISFIGSTELEKELTEPIVDLIQNIGLHQGDKDRFLQHLHV